MSSDARDDSHPGDEDLFDYAEGRLGRAREAEVAAHVGTCTVCRELVAAARGGASAVARVGVDPAVAAVPGPVADAVRVAVGAEWVRRPRGGVPRRAWRARLGDRRGRWALSGAGAAVAAAVVVVTAIGVTDVGGGGDRAAKSAGPTSSAGIATDAAAPATPSTSEGATAVARGQSGEAAGGSAQGAASAAEEAGRDVAPAPAAPPAAPAAARPGTPTVGAIATPLATCQLVRDPAGLPVVDCGSVVFATSGAAPAGPTATSQPSAPSAAR